MTQEPINRSAGEYLLVLFALPAGALLAWLALIATLYLPVGSLLADAVIPVAVVAAVAWLPWRRGFRWFAVALAVGGLLTVVFFLWLFWQLGQGNFD